jgi:hypothetical protein
MTERPRSRSDDAKLAVSGGGIVGGHVLRARDRGVLAEMLAAVGDSVEIRRDANVNAIVRDGLAAGFPPLE